MNISKEAVCPPCVEYVPQPAPERRVEKVPYQRKVIEYEEYEYEEKVPRQVTHIEYDDVKRVQTIQVPKKVVNYIAVETTVQMVPKVTEQRSVEMVPVERVYQKMVYRPVTRQIVHKPDNIDLPLTEPVIASRSNPINSYSRPNFTTVQSTYQLAPQPTFHSTYLPNQYEMPLQSPSFERKLTDPNYQTASTIQTPNPKLSNLNGKILQESLKSRGFNDERPISYHEFERVINDLTGGALRSDMAGSIWDRSAEKDRTTPLQLGRGLQELIKDDPRVRSLITRLN